MLLIENKKDSDMVATKKTYETRNSLSESTRVEMIALMNQELANTFDLHSQIKQAHWNVKGMNFIALHELFDQVAAVVLAFGDTIAERITALGGEAMGTIRMAAKTSELSEFPMGIKGGEEFVQAVADRVAAYANSARDAIDTAEEAGDTATEDMFTEIARTMDEQLYFIEAHLQG